jgi:hypothetical protein
MRLQLYFSPKSKACDDLRMFIKNQGISDLFEEYSIHKTPDEILAKLQLKFVPTIAVYNDKSDVIDLYEKLDAFKWVERFVMNRRQNMIKYAENNRRLVQQTEMKKKIKEGLYEYCKNETEGISDAYTYLADNIESAQPKSYLPYGKDIMYSIMTIPEDKTKKGYKLTEKEQRELSAKLLKERSEQDTMLKSAMETEQIEKVILNKSNF